MRARGFALGNPASSLFLARQVEREQGKGNTMSRNQNRKSKIIVGLAVFGLLITLYAPRASAFTAANYSGRYACGVTATSGAVGLGDFFTAIIRYRPNGAGAYDAGTLIASLTAFATPFPIVSATGDYCTYALDPAASSYTIGSDGTGNEVISWVASATNPAGCPGSFIDQTAIGVRNDLNVANQSIRAEFVDADLLGQDEAGRGTCLK
jgi:hypothetical protein